MEIIYSLDEIENVSKMFVSMIGDHKVITFSGDLGAGKTTLITSICKELGVQDKVTSPTYAIIQEYDSGNDNIIYHLDLYRLSNIGEAIEAGIEDCLISGRLCLIEWPENAISLFKENAFHVSLEVLSPQSRKLIVQLSQ